MERGVRSRCRQGGEEEEEEGETEEGRNDEGGDEEETERWDAGETRRPIHRPQELPKSTLIHGILAGISSHTHNHTLTHAG